MPKDSAAAMMYGILLLRLFFSIHTATIIEAIPTIMKKISWPPDISEDHHSLWHYSRYGAAQTPDSLK